MRTLLANTLVLSFLFFGCNEHNTNTKQVKIKGCVIDSITSLPMPNARVTLLCWYHAGWDKTDYVSIDTITDKSGCFNAIFEEGYKVVVAGVATGYAPILKESNDIDSSSLEISLKLKKTISNSSNITPSSDINLRNYIIDNSSN